MAKEVGTAQSMELVRDRFLHNFAEAFDYSYLERIGAGGSRIEDRHPLSSILNPRPAVF
jgi:hypothetical protein